MELQVDMGHVESRFGLFGDNIRVGARSRGELPLH